MLVRINGDDRELDIPSMSDTEVHQVLYEIETDLDDVIHQMEMAELDARSGAAPLDDSWFALAKRARKYKTRQVEFLKSELGRRRREQHKTLAQHFMAVSRLELSPEDYEDIEAMAKARMEGGNGEVAGG